ncbi:hypothetical protein GFL85_27210 [Rhizobium laguerreae]|uniref:hypothetical protein n=1 Tax=Rhizobium laguerreae TaxID=1076926 RepID=UPI00143F94B5|nr:hypothetical protein [Rhizobium laguerreae]NKM14654.1 hypothetical protein [Rhizobium laguerreae]
MHAAIAWAWLSDPTLSPGDVATLLMHAALSKQMGPLVRLLPSLLDAAPGVWQEIGDTAGIFSMFGVDDGYDTPFSTAIDRAVSDPAAADRCRGTNERGSRHYPACIKGS